MRKIFLGALAKGRPEVAMEAARKITVRHVVEDTFSFSEESTANGVVRSGNIDGTYAEVFLPNTPPAVTSGVNSEAITKMIVVSNALYVAMVDKHKNVARDCYDFWACALNRTSTRFGGGQENSLGICSKIIHADTPKAKGVRLLIKDAVPVLGIENPASSFSKQQSVFSRPFLVTNSPPQV